MKNGVEVLGVKDALRTLNDIDKKLRREITTNFKEIVDPIVKDGQALVPKKAPLSGFDRNWTPKGANGIVLPFQAGRAPRQPKDPNTVRGGWQHSRQGRRTMANWMIWQQKMNAFVSGKRPRMSNGYMKNLATFGVKWLGPASVLFDTSTVAHTPQGQRMVNALDARFGKASRVMWRAVEKSDGEVQQNVADFAENIVKQANEAMKKRARLMRAIGQ